MEIIKGGETLDRIWDRGRAIARFIFCTPDTPPYLSDHYRGAEEMLASTEPTPVQLEFLPYDSEGRYIEERGA